MKRTQIYLDDDIFQVLKKESQLTRKNISSIIRDTLRDKFMKKKYSNAVDETAGIWKDKDFNVDEYIRNLRTDNRLKELYGEENDNS
jgi:hypothetical protein